MANVVDHAATADDRKVGRGRSCTGQPRRPVVVADGRTGRPDSLLDGPRGSHPSAVDAEANGNDRATRSNHAAAAVAAAAGSGSDIHDEADYSRRHALHDVRTPPEPRSFLDHGESAIDNARGDVHPGPGESKQRKRIRSVRSSTAKQGTTYIGDAGHALTLELTTIEILHGRLKIGRRFKLDEAEENSRSVIRTRASERSSTED